MNIHYLLKKIKSTLGFGPEGEVEVLSFDEEGKVETGLSLKPYFATLVVILALSLSFGLGRLSAPSERAGIQIEYDPEISGRVEQGRQSASVIQAISPTSVVGSSKGSKYHFAHCPGAKQISEANKIVFRTPEEAQKAGYSLASNCKPQ